MRGDCLGMILQAQCTSCGFQKELLTGGGLADCSFDTVCSALSEEKQEQLKQAAAGGLTGLSIWRIPCRCRNCHTFYARPVVDYERKDGAGTIVGECPACASPEGDDLSGLEQVAGGCPKCGSDVLLKRQGHWD